MADTANGYQLTVMSGAGTSLLSSCASVLHSVAQPSGTAAGTVAFYDSATAAGTSSTNLKFSPVYSILTPQPNVYDYQFRNGIVAVTSGAGTLTIAVE